MVNLFILDNGDTDGKAKNYLHKRPDHTYKYDIYDIATCSSYVPGTERDYTHDESNKGPRIVTALGYHMHRGMSIE